MRGCFITAVIFLTIICNCKAQNVTIPDTAFASFLRTYIPSCVNGNQMDTTCPAVSTATSFYCVAQNVNDITGIQYFRSLTFLNCLNNNLTFLPPLPKGLTQLFCQTNKLTSLPPLPSGLTVISCNNNNVTAIPIALKRIDYS